MQEDKQQDDGQVSTSEKPELKDNGFVARSELPNCPNGHDGRLVLSKSREGFQRLHCDECHQAIALFSTAYGSIDEENRHWAVVGPKAWGTGETEEEATENMKEFADEDGVPVADVYVSNYPISCDGYGGVHSKEESDAILHHKGKKYVEF